MEPGDTIILTGATGGLGKAIVQHLVSLSYTFNAILTARNLYSPRTKALRKMIGDDERFHIVSLDLDSLESVRSFSSYIKNHIYRGDLKPVQALMLNAGYMSSRGPSYTRDGLERAFQTNYLANFLLVHLLLPCMERDRGRIVFVTSFSHDTRRKSSKMLPLPKQLWRSAELLARPPPVDRENGTHAGHRRYAESKMCLMMLMHSVQERLDSVKELRNIVTVAVDPGYVCATGLMRQQDFFHRVILRTVLGILTPVMQAIHPNSLLRTSKRSARDILIGATGRRSRARVHDIKGKVLNGSKIQETSLESRDKRKQAMLWEWSVVLADLSREEEREAFSDGEMSSAGSSFEEKC